MHKAILESAKYSEVKFTPDRVEGQPAAGAAESELELHGRFLLHGVAHELTMTANVHEDDGVLKISSRFQVPYVDWGLKSASMFILKVADTVDIHIEADAKVTGD
jgi:hypothetical protein